MDPVDISKFRQLYKRKASTYSTAQQLSELENNRRITRDTLFFKNRRISHLILTPEPTLKPEKIEKIEDEGMDRRKMLQRWKVDRENRLKEEKSKQKPAFKPCAVPNIGFPKIKQPNKSQSQTKPVQTNTLSFAPKNHVFKAPKNIKPINVILPSKPKETGKVKKQDLSKKPPTNSVFQRVTRSQKPIASPPCSLPGRQRKKDVEIKKPPLKEPAKKTGPKNTQKTEMQQKNDKPLKKGPLKRQQRIELDDNVLKEASNLLKINISPSKKLNETFEIEKPKSVPKKTERRKSLRRTRSTVQTPDQMPELLIVEEKVTSQRNSRKSIKSSVANKPSKTDAEADKENVPNSSVDLGVNEDLCKSMSTVYSQKSDVNTTQEDSTLLGSPERVVYISPFVTTKRGKGSVRKENWERKSRGIPSLSAHNTSDETSAALRVAGAEYFQTMLNNEIGRLRQMCDTWDSYKATQALPEDATDLIDVAVGQANLLMNKKFEQFRGLINHCQDGTGDRPVTCEDLHGFWDMIYMQVENLDLRFNRLVELRAQGWQEMLPQAKKVAAKKKPAAKRKSVGASSNLRAAIRAARSKTKSAEGEDGAAGSQNVFNGGFFLVQSPDKLALPQPSPRRTSTRARKSLLATVLTVNSERAQQALRASPGITMIRASQTAKSVEKAISEKTPAKSILKPSGSSVKKSRPASKAVLFQDEGTAAALNCSNLISFDTPESNRRSLRLKTKLRYD